MYNIEYIHHSIRERLIIVIKLIILYNFFVQYSFICFILSFLYCIFYIVSIAHIHFNYYLLPSAAVGLFGIQLIFVCS